MKPPVDLTAERESRQNDATIDEAVNLAAIVALHFITGYLEGTGIEVMEVDVVMEWQ